MAKKSTLTPQDARRAIDRGIARIEQRTAGKSERERENALRIYLNDPEIKKLQAIVTREETRQQSRTVPLAPLFRAAGVSDETLAGFNAAFTNPFGLTDRVLALVGSTTPNAPSYSARLEGRRATSAALREQAPVASFVGDVAQAIPTGLAVTGGLRAGGNVLAQTGTRSGQAANRLIQSATTLQQGQRGRNVAKIITAGGAYGGAEALGRGEDVTTGVAYGAAAAPVVVGGFKTTAWLGRKASDVLGLTGGQKALRDIITEPMENVQARIAAARANGVEPTIFEVLSPTDRRRLADNVIARSDETRAAAQTAVQERGASIPAAMRGVSETANAPRRAEIIQGIEQDINRSVGAPVPQASTLAREAARAPQDIQPLAALEAEQFIAPVAKIPVAAKVEDFYPKGYRTLPNGKVEETQPWPELNATIRAAFGRLALKTDETAPLTVEQVNAALSRLRSQFGSSDRNQAQLAEEAAGVLEDMMRAADPRVGAAVDASRQAYFNRMSMGEGMAEGARTRLYEDIPAGSAAAAQDVRNAFNTPAGTAGRALGQQNQLERAFRGTPDEALRLTEDIAQSERTRAALAQNLGQEPADVIAAAARQQQQGMQNIASAARVQVDAPEDTLPMVGRAVLGLSPSALPGTRIWALNWLVNRVAVPEPAARQIVNRVLSQDPVVVEQTLRFLRDRTDYGNEFMRQMLTATAAGQQGARVGEFMNTPSSVPSTEQAAPAAEEMAMEEATAPVEGEIIEAPTEFATAGDVVSFLYPEARVTQVERDPNSALGRKNPNSAHNMGVKAVDVAPIEGMTFEEFVMGFEDAGFSVKYARDEVNDPSSHATGPHWHVELE